MKVVAKPIDMLALFDVAGLIHPLRFRLEEDERIVIKVDEVFSRNLEKKAGIPVLTFDCISIIEGQRRAYQLKYEIEENRWILFKI